MEEWVAVQQNSSEDTWQVNGTIIHGKTREGHKIVDRSYKGPQKK